MKLKFGLGFSIYLWNEEFRDITITEEVITYTRPDREKAHIYLPRSWTENSDGQSSASCEAPPVKISRNSSSSTCCSKLSQSSISSNDQGIVKSLERSKDHISDLDNTLSRITDEMVNMKKKNDMQLLNLQSKLSSFQTSFNLLETVIKGNDKSLEDLKNRFNLVEKNNQNSLCKKKYDDLDTKVTGEIKKLCQEFESHKNKIKDEIQDEAGSIYININDDIGGRLKIVERAINELLAVRLRNVVK